MGSFFGKLPDLKTTVKSNCTSNCCTADNSISTILNRGGTVRCQYCRGTGSVKKIDIEDPKICDFEYSRKSIQWPRV